MESFSTPGNQTVIQERSGLPGRQNTSFWVPAGFGVIAQVEKHEEMFWNMYLDVG